MIIYPPTLKPTGRTTDVSLRVDWESQPVSTSFLNFKLPDDPNGTFPIPMDFALPLTLLPAQKKGEDLNFSHPVSPKLLNAVPTIQNMYRVWEYAPHRLTIHSPAGAPASPVPPRSVACFFSGGVDSFYTLVKRRDEISHLIYVHGFDVALSDQWRRDRVSALLRKIANHFGKTLLEIETDLRQYSDPLAIWDDYHGAALAGVALLLSPRFQKVYIPATFTYADLIPLGSHPMLDPLWSTEAVEIVHDGCEASRFDKLKFMADQSIMRETLRVCWRNVGQELNCGLCEKCLRTLLCLEILDLSCDTFPKPLDLEMLSRLVIDDRWKVRYGQYRTAAKKAGKTAVVQALDQVLSNPQHPPPPDHRGRLHRSWNALRQIWGPTLNIF